MYLHTFVSAKKLIKELLKLHILLLKIVDREMGMNKQSVHIPNQVHMYYIIYISKISS